MGRMIRMRNWSDGKDDKENIRPSFLKENEEIIVERLKKLSKLRADKDCDLESEMKKLKPLVGDIIEATAKVEERMAEQDAEFSKHLKKTSEKYKTDELPELTENIKTREDEIRKLVDRYNNAVENGMKEAHYTELTKKIKELQTIASNFGSAVERTDVEPVLESLNYYDQNYDENVSRSVIKNYDKLKKDD